MNSGKRPYLLVFLAIAILFSGCGKNELKRVIEDHFNALNRHDIKALVAGYDPKVEVTSSGWEGIHNGTAEVSAAYSKYFHSSPDLKYDVGNVYFSGDSIITVEYTASGTMKNPEGLPAYMLGKRYILNYCAIFTVKKGRITKEASYFDQVSFLNQMGFFEQK